MNVCGIAARRIDGKDDQGRFDDFRDAVYDVAPEEQQLAGAEFEGIASVHDELAAAADYLQIFIAGLVEVGRHGAVDTK